MIEHVYWNLFKTSGRSRDESFTTPPVWWNWSHRVFEWFWPILPHKVPKVRWRFSTGVLHGEGTCRTYCLFETTIAAGAPWLLGNSSDHFSDSVWNLVLAGTTVDYCATNATVYLATTSLWQSYESSPWGVSCVTHFIGHQLILICTKWQDCFLITDTVMTLHAFMHLPFFMCSILFPVSLLLLT